MKKILICLLSFFLLASCSGSRYYFNKRIAHPQENLQEETWKTQVPTKTEELCPIVATGNPEHYSSTPEKPLPVKAAGKPKEPQKEKTIKTFAEQNRPVVSVQPIFKETDQVAPKTQIINQRKKNKVDETGIFLIILLGLVLGIFVTALILGATVLEAFLTVLGVILVTVIIISSVVEFFQ